MKYGLSTAQLAKLRQAFSALPQIEEVVLFGSRAWGSYQKASDIDLALKGTQVNMSCIEKLKDALEQETLLPFFFDLVSYHSLRDRDLRGAIDHHGVVIYQQ